MSLPGCIAEAGRVLGTGSAEWTRAVGRRAGTALSIEAHAQGFGDGVRRNAQWRLRRLSVLGTGRQAHRQVHDQAKWERQAEKGNVAQKAGGAPRAVCRRIPARW